jgi:outer membrane protein assembly factor BamD
MSAAEIYVQGKNFLDAQDFVNAIKLFELLEARYPFGTYSTQSMLDLAYANYAADLKDEAIVEANRFIRLYPNHPNVDYAYYLKALANFNKDANFFTKMLGHDQSKYDVTNLKQSFNDFSLVINKFPKSKYAKDSRNRLLYLKNTMAANEFYIAEYYSKRSAHLAAIERIKYLFKNYGGTPITEKALNLLIHSYNELEIYDLAYDSARVLLKNYPEYKIVSSNSNQPIMVKKNIKIKPKEPVKEIKDESWFDYLNVFD